MKFLIVHFSTASWCFLFSCPNTPFSTLFSETLNLQCSSLEVGNPDSVKFSETNKIKRHVRDSAIYLSIYLSICLSVCVCLSACLPIYISMALQSFCWTLAAFSVS
jgi:hypothetical protein